LLASFGSMGPSCGSAKAVAYGWSQGGGAALITAAPGTASLDLSPRRNHAETF